MSDCDEIDPVDFITVGELVLGYYVSASGGQKRDVFRCRKLTRLKKIKVAVCRIEAWRKTKLSRGYPLHFKGVLPHSILEISILLGFRSNCRH